MQHKNNVTFPFNPTWLVLVIIYNSFIPQFWRHSYYIHLNNNNAQIHLVPMDITLESSEVDVQGILIYWICYHQVPTDICLLRPEPIQPPSTPDGRNWTGPCLSDWHLVYLLSENNLTQGNMTRTLGIHQAGLTQSDGSSNSCGLGEKMETMSVRYSLNIFLNWTIWQLAVICIILFLLIESGARHIASCPGQASYL